MPEQLNRILSKLDQYLSTGFFWFWIGIGVILVFKSTQSYGASITATFLGFIYFIYGLFWLIKARRAGSDNLLPMVAIAVVGFLMLSIGQSGETRHIRAFETDFAPLITALEHYEKETGEYPEVLKKLVPEYLNILPECPARTSSTAGDRSVYYGRHDTGGYFMQCTIGAFVFPYRAMRGSKDKDWFYFN